MYLLVQEKVTPTALTIIHRAAEACFRQQELQSLPTTVAHSRLRMSYVLNSTCTVELCHSRERKALLITGMLTPSALSKLTMLSISNRLLAPLEVDLSLSLARISVFLLLA